MLQRQSPAIASLLLALPIHFATLSLAPCVCSFPTSVASVGRFKTVTSTLSIPIFDLSPKPDPATTPLLLLSANPHQHSPPSRLSSPSHSPILSRPHPSKCSLCHSQINPSTIRTPHPPRLLNFFSSSFLLESTLAIYAAPYRD
jgi:hypothetical protein